MLIRRLDKKVKNVFVYEETTSDFYITDPPEYRKREDLFLSFCKVVIVVSGSFLFFLAYNLFTINGFTFWILLPILAFVMPLAYFAPDFGFFPEISLETRGFKIRAQSILSNVSGLKKWVSPKAEVVFRRNKWFASMPKKEIVEVLVNIAGFLNNLSCYCGRCKNVPDFKRSCSDKYERSKKLSLFCFLLKHIDSKSFELLMSEDFDTTSRISGLSSSNVLNTRDGLMKLVLVHKSFAISRDIIDLRKRREEKFSKVFETIGDCFEFVKETTTKILCFAGRIIKWITTPVWIWIYWFGKLIITCWIMFSTFMNRCPIVSKSVPLFKVEESPYSWELTED